MGRSASEMGKSFFGRCEGVLRANFEIREKAVDFNDWLNFAAKYAD